MKSICLFSLWKWPFNVIWFTKHLFFKNNTGVSFCGSFMCQDAVYLEGSKIWLIFFSDLISLKIYVWYEKLLERERALNFFFSLNKLIFQYLLDCIIACGCAVISGLITCNPQKLQGALWQLVAWNVWKWTFVKAGEEIKYRKAAKVTCHWLPARSGNFTQWWRCKELSDNTH